METPQLLTALAFVLVAAFLGASLAARLRQSVILGYLVAGVAIGPFTPGPVGDVAAVQSLADIGIILLLFAIGVQFSIRDLLRVGRIATVGGLVQVLVMIGMGYAVGSALGWGLLEALFFGAVISNSSSTVLAKVLSERGETGSMHGRIAVAWSGVQDLSTVVLVVVFSGLAVQAEPDLASVGWAISHAAVFLAIVVPLGAVVLPPLFERVARQPREVFVLMVAVVALGTAYVSTFFGLSIALGAFLAGIVVSESDLSHEILGTVMPLRDVFAGIFFVSVGMLVNPAFVLEHWALVLVAVTLIVLVKGTVSALLTAAGRYPARTALLAGAGLAQSAEFSFLLARLGVDLGAVGPQAFSLMLAGAVVSIALSPLLHAAASPLSDWVEKRMPLSSLADHPDLFVDGANGPRGHVVVCGFGRVGRVVGAVLRRRGFPFIAIDEDQAVVRTLRERGIVALLGSASNPVLLDRVGLDRARVLVVAIPDPVVARQVVDYARRVNPRIDIVVRTHSQSEREFLSRRGVNEAVLGELELALEMTRHTLRRFGVSAQETLAIVQRLRETGLVDMDVERTE